MSMKWHLETRKIKDLKPHPNNPRKLSKHDADHLQKSLDKFGLIDKPIITADGMIIGGHQRIALLKKNKAKEVECWVSDEPLDEKEVDELHIRLNRAQGEWDWELLGNVFESEDLVEWGFSEDDLFGWNAEEVETAQPAEAKQTKKQKTCPNCGHQY